MLICRVESLWAFGFEKGINGHLIMTNERSRGALMNANHWFAFIFLTLVSNFRLKELTKFRGKKRVISLDLPGFQHNFFHDI